MLPADTRTFQSIRPSVSVVLITPDDDNALEQAIMAISFAVAGDLRIETARGDVVTIPADALAAGMQHPIQIKKVFATGTTATGIVGYL